MNMAQAMLPISIWTQLGVGGIFVLLVLRMVFEFVKNRKNSNGLPVWAAKMSLQILDLHEWHAPEGGEQTWKNNHMLKLVEANNVLLAESHALLKEHHILMKRLIPLLEKMTV